MAIRYRSFSVRENWSSGGKAAGAPRLCRWQLLEMMLLPFVTPAVQENPCRRWRSVVAERQGTAVVLRVREGIRLFLHPNRGGYTEVPWPGLVILELQQRAILDIGGQKRHMTG